MSELKVRLEKPHNEACRIKNQTDRPRFWLNTYDGAKHVGRDSLGRRNGQNYRWIPLGCCDPKCDGVVLVRVDGIVEAVEEALTGKPRK